MVAALGTLGLAVALVLAEPRVLAEAPPAETAVWMGGMQASVLVAAAAAGPLGRAAAPTVATAELCLTAEVVPQVEVRGVGELPAMVDRREVEAVNPAGAVQPAAIRMEAAAPRDRAGPPEAGAIPQLAEAVAAALVEQRAAAVRPVIRRPTEARMAVAAHSAGPIRIGTPGLSCSR